MADVLIKGMEMWEVCGLCPCFHAENPMYCQVDKTIRMTAPYGKKMEDCPLVEVPEHGRLIDADALIAVLKRKAEKDGVEGLFLLYFADILKRYPKVLEASK